MFLERHSTISRKLILYVRGKECGWLCVYYYYSFFFCHLNKIECFYLNKMIRYLLDWGKFPLFYVKLWLKAGLLYCRLQRNKYGIILHFTNIPFYLNFSLQDSSFLDYWPPLTNDKKKKFSQKNDLAHIRVQFIYRTNPLITRIIIFTTDNV